MPLASVPYHDGEAVCECYGGIMVGAKRGRRTGADKDQRETRRADPSDGSELIPTTLGELQPIR